MTARLALHFIPDRAPDAGLMRAMALDGALGGVGCFAASRLQAAECERQLRQFGHDGQVEWVAPDRPQDLARFGVLVHPGGDIERLAWRRLAPGERRYSLCGTIDTTASHAAMSTLTGLLAAPVRSWDALVCTSRVVRDSVRELLERQADYLRARLGAQRFELPQLPLIPPGVHCADLAFGPDARAAARRRLGIGEDDVAILFPSRFSFDACTHPQQMFSALERARQPDRRVHLVVCGRFADEASERALREAAAALCPSIRLTILDAGAPDERAAAWAAADVFTSLPDQVRHTSGSGAAEAMAAGLPCVVGDWNGDRDTVRDGVDGYRIPTVMPGPGAGLDLAQRYDDGVDSFDTYCGHISQAVAVDGARLADAYGQLIRDAGLRRQLGDNARRRALESFDWPIVFGRYRQLWSELDERRRADPALGPALPAGAPDRLDPFALFARYPSAQITPQSLVELAPEATLALVRQYRELGINRFATASLPTLEEFGQIFGSIGSRPMQVEELLDTLGPCDQPTLLRGLAWLCKMDLLRIGAASE